MVLVVEVLQQPEQDREALGIRQAHLRAKEIMVVLVTVLLALLGLGVVEAERVPQVVMHKQVLLTMQVVAVPVAQQLFQAHR